MPSWDAPCFRARTKLPSIKNFFSVSVGKETVSKTRFAFSSSIKSRLPSAYMPSTSKSNSAFFCVSLNSVTSIKIKLPLAAVENGVYDKQPENKSQIPRNAARQQPKPMQLFRRHPDPCFGRRKSTSKSKKPLRISQTVKKIKRARMESAGTT